MSASMIRRGLELFSEKDGEKHKQKQKKSSGNKQRLHRQTVKSKTTVKDKHIKSAVDPLKSALPLSDEYRKRQKKNHLSSNLEYFLAAANKTQTKHTGKIIQQHSGRRACHQPDLPVTKPEEKSVFTEQEFQKFQQEYFSKL
ncbi:Active regulator of SIRT1 40S ribosomal protein S19-binding protein 1 [Triplophysa tibetana]|uniref:Active regulator of SIRT1 n=1 Tax=Triplophysa tibetana TaxID=1572043 RepID=A0A5A9NYR1_9TELE|nr:Active regulator of SIRT1 40S ribosomal protein S19-binding protein 1 [Triplophysa tibetana]